MAMYSVPHRRGRTTILSVIVGVVLSGALLGAAPTVPIARAADPSADIPGVPLPGPVAAGRLGGAIYDVVYRFPVAPGYVIVASLTGAAGTDFDLYLFDASATTVLSTTGQLVKSKGPTSTESISWPSRFGGTYYIDMNGATAVEGDYRLTVQTVPDPTPPMVSMVLANGRAATNQLTVSVTLTASDDLSGVTEMALSEDGATYADWQAFQRSTSWTFAPGDGPRTLWAKVRNGVGLESTAATANVTIDTDPPSIIGFEPAPGSSVVGLRPRFTITFDEPMDPTTWNDLGLIVQSATGGLVLGDYAYDSAARVGSFIPSVALQPGAPYIVTVGNVKDIAGNAVSFPGSWSVTPLVPTAFVVRTGPSVVARGGSVRVALTLTGARLPASVEVLASISSAPFDSFATISSVDGLASLLVTPASNTTYRFRYAGAFGIAPAQVDIRVLVRRSVALIGRSSTVVSSAKVGRSVTLVAVIGPAKAGVSVSFRLYRFDAARRTWIYAGSRGRGTDASGRASYVWVPASASSWYWRASVASTLDFATNMSPVYRWSVSR